MTACCCRLTQPETRRTKNANGGGSEFIGKHARGAPPVQGVQSGDRLGPRFSRHTLPSTASMRPMFGDPSSAEFSHRTGWAIRWRELEIAPDGTTKKVLHYEALGKI